MVVQMQSHLTAEEREGFDDAISPAPIDAKTGNPSRSLAAWLAAFAALSLLAGYTSLYNTATDGDCWPSVRAQVWLEVIGVIVYMLLA